MARAILVTGSCQIFGIAAVLAAIFPDDEVRARTWPITEIDLANCDILVYDTLYEDTASHFLRLCLTDKIRSIRYCRIRFSGFHPDLCYARVKATGALTTHHYNSAIALWAFNNRLSITDAELLFDDETVRDIGYLSIFDRAMRVLEDDFANADIKFADFFLPAKRAGCFMHTYNHPNIFTVTHLGRLIAKTIGCSPVRLASHLGINDGLASEIWPVYPAVAEEHSLCEGSYCWKVGDTFIYGLRDYLDHTYNRLQSAGVGPGDVEPILVSKIDIAHYDRVLGERLGRLGC